MPDSPDEKQQTAKAKPRGKPFPPGISGNPKGRPKGALNKFTWAVLGNPTPAPLKPGIFLDKDYPYMRRGNFFIQRGRSFNELTLEALPEEPLPKPERLDRRQKWGCELIYQGKPCIFTADDGWLFDRATLLVID